MINPDVVGISPEIKGKKRRIRIWPKDSEVLHTPCEPITEFDEELHVLIADMFATLLELTEGVALAANQIVVSKRLFVAHMPYHSEIMPDSPTATPEYGTSFFDYVCINPEIIGFDTKYPYGYDEGCLSLPGYYEYKKRPSPIKLRYFDPIGNKHEKMLYGFEAFAIQHEMDHLDGKLFIDGYSNLKLDKVKRVIKKKGKRLG